MKKLLTILIVCLIAVSSIFAQGKMESERPAKMDVKTGLALITSASGKSATSKGYGQGAADILIAAVIVTEDGKIDSCVIDAIQGKLTYSHGQAHGNPAMVTTAAPQRASYTVSGPRDPSGLALWFRRPSPVPFDS